MDAVHSSITKNLDGTIAWTPPSGKTITYRETQTGTFYHAQTPKAVVDELESARQGNKRVRLFYGDAVTGRDWLEEHDVQGTLGRTMGPLKVPGLASASREGLDALLDHCVVRIQVAGRDVYRHPHYHQPTLATQDSGEPSLPYGVFADGKNHASFKTPEARAKFLDFIRGEPKRPSQGNGQTR